MKQWEPEYSGGPQLFGPRDWFFQGQGTGGRAQASFPRLVPNRPGTHTGPHPGAGDPWSIGQRKEEGREGGKKRERERGLEEGGREGRGTNVQRSYEVFFQCD